MDPSTLSQCEQIIGYKFSDVGLLSLALTHASVAPTRVQSNERLEFLGDSILGLVVCSTLYERHSDLMEGEMTRIKSAVVSRQRARRDRRQAGPGRLAPSGQGHGQPRRTALFGGRRPL